MERAELEAAAREAQLQGQLEQARDTIARLKDELKKKDITMSTPSEREKHLHVEVKAAGYENDAMKHELWQLEEENLKKQAELEGKKVELRETVARLSGVEGQRDAQLGARDQKLRQLDNQLRKQAQDFDEKEYTLRTRMEELMRANEVQRESIKKQETEIEDLKERVEQMNAPRLITKLVQTSLENGLEASRLMDELDRSMHEKRDTVRQAFLTLSRAEEEKKLRSAWPYKNVPMPTTTSNIHEMEGALGLMQTVLSSTISQWKDDVQDARFKLRMSDRPRHLSDLNLPTDGIRNDLTRYHFLYPSLMPMMTVRDAKVGPPNSARYLSARDRADRVLFAEKAAKAKHGRQRPHSASASTSTSTAPRDASEAVAQPKRGKPKARGSRRASEASGAMERPPALRRTSVPVFHKTGSASKGYSLPKSTKKKVTFQAA